MSITIRLRRIKENLPQNVRLIAVSKFHDNDAILEAYRTGQRLFGESKVQELYHKYQSLPKDIEWHFIGHLQTNKIRYIASFIEMIHSIDSIRLLNEVDYYATKYQRKIKGLLQIHIAQESHKFGFSFEEADFFFRSKDWKLFKGIEIVGLMGLATFTRDEKQISREFSQLSDFFALIKKQYWADYDSFKELSMGMSNDYLLAIRHGSTFVRIGSSIFGEREQADREIGDQDLINH